MVDDQTYESRVAQALADKLAAIPDLIAAPYMLPSPSGPCAEVIDGEVEYDKTFGRGSDDWQMVVRVSVPGATLGEAAQLSLREYRSPHGERSIKKCLEQDRTLGGLVAGLRVVRVSGIRAYRRPNGDTCLGCDFEVTFMADGLEE